jgi:hypothetical protein
MTRGECSAPGAGTERVENRYEAQRSNAMRDKGPLPGDIIYVHRGVYKHYGVYAGESRVVHFAPLAGAEINAENAVVHETTLEAFLKGGVLAVDHASRAKFPREEIVRRARGCAGSKDYSLIVHNCEHFARWCVTGVYKSRQVEQAADIVVEGLGFVAEVIDGGNTAKTGKKLLSKLKNYLQ